MSEGPPWLQQTYLRLTDLLLKMCISECETAPHMLFIRQGLRAQSKTTVNLAHDAVDKVRPDQLLKLTL